MTLQISKLKFFLTLKRLSTQLITKIWFKNYLENREQFVYIDGTKSKQKIMEYGVPQGSVLGPLLFLIFINDLASCTEFFTLLFADDTTFQLSDSNVENLFKRSNEELSKAANWFQSNKLSLNVKKTKFMLFRPKSKNIDFSNLTLKIGNSDIDRIGAGCKETGFKFVGHVIDEFLSWDDHLKHVTSKLSSANYALSKSKNFLPLKARKLAYNSLFRPHLEFGILAWSCALQGKLHQIVNLQKKMCTSCLQNKQKSTY